MTSAHTALNLKPTTAFIIHQAQTEKLSLMEELDKSLIRSNYQSQTPVITCHSFVDSDLGPVLGVGKSLTDASRQEIAKLMLATANDEVEESLVEDEWSDRLLHKTSLYQVWYTPPAKRKMFFSIGKKFFRELWWPGLIFFYHVDLGFRIFSYAGKGRPVKTQKLYHAPLFNVYDAGNVCLGSAAGSEFLNTQGRNAWEDAIFKSNFTHSNTNLVVKGFDRDDTTYIKLIKELSKSGDRFAAKYLIPHSKHKTLINFLSQIESNVLKG